MTRLLYIANNRIPTEKAHGLQIVQMCEAFTQAGYEVTLVTAQRINTPEMKAIPDLWAHYGVKKSFDFKRLPCLDLINTVPARFQQIAFLLQTFTYWLSLWIWLLFHRFDVYYTRDIFIGTLFKLFRPWSTLVYEVHQINQSSIGRRIQGFLARRVKTVTVTRHLAKRMRQLGAQSVTAEHDGARLGRFEQMPSQEAARIRLGIAPETFVVGYVGQFHAMNVSKGLDMLVDAIAVAVQAGTAVELLIVGGQPEGITELRQRWAAHHLADDHLHMPGQVDPEAVSLYLAAMDVGIMPQPWTEYFAYYTSALKLFEYMAAGCAIIGTNLPSTAEVVRHGETALLVPPGNIAAFAGAIHQLYVDGDLCRRLGQQAKREAQYYTWDARAARIRNFIEDQNS